MSQNPADEFERAILKRELPKDFAASVSGAFGPLSPSAREILIYSVASAFLAYYWDRLKREQTPGASRALRYRSIHKAATRLIALLEDPPSTSGTAARPEERVTTLDRGLGECLNGILLDRARFDDAIYSVLRNGLPPPGGVATEALVRGSNLSLTHHAAIEISITWIEAISLAALAAHKSTKSAIRPGKGGARHTEVKSTTALLTELFAVYAEMRSLHPNSGPAPAYHPGNALDIFIKTNINSARMFCKELSYVTDGAIRGALSRLQGSCRFRFPEIRRLNQQKSHR